MEYHYVYQILNKHNGKKYIGLRSSSIKPELDLGHKYFSSSTDLSFLEDQRSNPEFYEYEILKNFDNRKDAALYEIELHTKYNVGISEEFYNKCNATTTMFDVKGTTLSDEHREKIGKAVKGRIFTEETRKRMSDAQTGRIVSESSKTKQSQTMKGKYTGENHPMYGKTHSKEAKEKIGNSSSGRSHTEESKQKIREHLKHNHPTKGRPLSEEHKQKLSKSKIGTTPANKGIPDRIVKCPHCTKEGGYSAMMRWHFNNCSKKNI